MAVVCAFLLVKRMTLPMLVWRYCNKIRLIQSTMKNLKYLSLMLLCAAMSLSFTSCSDDDDAESTYTFVYNTSTLWGETSVILFECDKNGDKIKNNSIECEKGYTETFTASPSAEKIKVYIDDRWVQQVFPLNKGGNIVIEITGSTIIGREEP